MRASFVCLRCRNAFTMNTEMGWDGNPQFRHYNLDFKVCDGELVDAQDPRAPEPAKLTQEQGDRAAKAIQEAIYRAAQERGRED